MKDYLASLAPLAALLMLACDQQGPMIGDTGEGDDVSSDGSSADAGVDGEGDDDTGDGDTGDTGDTGDCSLGEYVPIPHYDSPDWPTISGLVTHDVAHSDSAFGPSTQYVDARFYTTDWVDDSLLCIESILEPIGVDSCWVWYTHGEGKAAMGTTSSTTISRSRRSPSTWVTVRSRSRSRPQTI